MQFISDIITNNAMEILLFLIGAPFSVVGLFLAFATAKLPRKWQNAIELSFKEKEAIMRKALRESASNGLAAGIEQGLQGSDLLIHAIKHVISGVPDTIAEFKPDAETLTNIIVAQMGITRDDTITERAVNVAINQGGNLLQTFRVMRARAKG